MKNAKYKIQWKSWKKSWKFLGKYFIMQGFLSYSGENILMNKFCWKPFGICWRESISLSKSGHILNHCRLLVLCKMLFEKVCCICVKWHHQKFNLRWLVHLVSSVSCNRRGIVDVISNLLSIVKICLKNLI